MLICAVGRKWMLLLKVLILLQRLVLKRRNSVPEYLLASCAISLLNGSECSNELLMDFIIAFALVVL